MRKLENWNNCQWSWHHKPPTLAKNSHVPYRERYRINGTGKDCPKGEIPNVR